MVDSELLTAPSIIEYPFKRTTGPIIGGFLTGLREGILVGSKGSDGRVHVPPLEYDPDTHAQLTELVEVGPGAVVTTWAWVHTPPPKAPLSAKWLLAPLSVFGLLFLSLIAFGLRSMIRTRRAAKRYAQALGYSSTSSPS